MTVARADVPLVAGVALLERALGYTLAALRIVTPDLVHRRTPCLRWDLATLLDHMDDSLAALHEATAGRRVELEPAPGERLHPVDAVDRLRARGCRLLGDWTALSDVPASPGPTVSVAGRPLTPAVVAAAGAMEVAVHGWDVARACGRRHPMPPTLAAELLDLAPLLVSDADRRGRFGPALPVAAGAGSEQRLLGFLGRDPG
jgi:uncharacterized protein (TIGR03086 family)